MSEFYKFANESPLFAFILVMALVYVLALPFKMVNRVLRHRNIRAKGWPPEHLDADGDAIDQCEEKEE